MYAIEAQTAHATDRPRDGDLLSVSPIEKGDGEQAPEKSKFEHELESALKELVHEDDAVSDTTSTETKAKTSDHGVKAPSREVRESMLAALSKAIGEGDGAPVRGGRKRPPRGERQSGEADSSKVARLAKDRLEDVVPEALHHGEKGDDSRVKASQDRANSDRKSKAASINRRSGASSDPNEELELLPAVIDDGLQTDADSEAAVAAGAKGSVPRQDADAKAAAAVQRESGERVSMKPDVTARASGPAAAAGEESSRKRAPGNPARHGSIRGSGRREAGESATRESATRDKNTDKRALATDSFQNRDAVADDKSVDRFERPAPRDDAKRSARKDTVVELEVRDLRNPAERVNEGEVRQARGAPPEGLADSSVDTRTRSGSAAQTRVVLDNLAREVRENINGDIVRNARIILRGNDSGEVRLSLHPEELGRVRVQLQMQENVLMGRIVVDNSAVREIFEQNLPQLIRAFQESGWETESLDVSVSDGESEGERGRDDSSGRPRRHTQETSTERRYTVEERGLIDVMA